MKYVLPLLTTILLLAAAPARAATPVMNMIDVPVPIQPDGSRYPIEDVRAAIIQGCQAQRWSVEITGDGVLLARFNNKNKHFANVEITYSEHTYSIVYHSSENLDYNPKRDTIHRNYNNWILRLSASIDKQFPLLDARAASAEELESLVEELLKIDDLRDRGILTDDEFDAEKRRLLTRD
jgi:hypothetical protein